MRNLRVAETEKYAHVTYFFNGGIEKPFPGEDRVTGAVAQGRDLRSEAGDDRRRASPTPSSRRSKTTTFDVMVVNFANADMVGHSGKIPPTITAVETVDACLGQIYTALRRDGGAMIITADHGNAEQMIDPATGGPHTSHTTNPVPFIVAAEHAVTPANFKGDARRFTLKPDGALQDIAPTMLGILGIPQPKEMTGHDLRVVAAAAQDADEITSRSGAPFKRPVFWPLEWGLAIHYPLSTDLLHCIRRMTAAKSPQHGKLFPVACCHRQFPGLDPRRLRLLRPRIHAGRACQISRPEK